MSVISNAASERAAEHAPASKPAKPAKNARAERAVASHGAAAAPRGQRASAALSAGIIAAALAVGIAAGTTVMHRRYHAMDVAIAVNGATITEADILHRMETMAGPKALQQLVGEDLLIQYAQKRGLAPSDQAVAAEAAKPAQGPGMRHFLGIAGEGQEDILHRLRFGMARMALFTQDATATEADARKFYEVNVNPKNPNARFYTPEAAQIAVIITQSEDQAKAAMLDLGRGVPFATVVKSRSTDVSSKNSGLLPPISRGRASAALRGRPLGAQVAALENTIFGLRIGETPGPNKFAGAWWIIRCLDKKPSVTLSYDKVRDECMMGAKMAKVRPETLRRIESDMADMQKTARIEALWPQYRAAVEEMGKTQ